MHQYWAYEQCFVIATHTFLTIQTHANQERVKHIAHGAWHICHAIKHAANSSCKSDGNGITTECAVAKAAQISSDIF